MVVLTQSRFNIHDLLLFVLGWNQTYPVSLSTLFRANPHNLFDLYIMSMFDLHKTDVYKRVGLFREAPFQNPLLVNSMRYTCLSLFVLGLYQTFPVSLSTLFHANAHNL